MFDAVNTLKSCIAVYIAMLPNVSVKKEKMKQAAQHGFLNATDLADYLASKGVPFREAHGIAGRSVSSYAISQNKELHELSLEE